MDYMRLEEEAKSGYPQWPCPHCGEDRWRVEGTIGRSKKESPVTFPVSCIYCGVIETAHHVDGEWMGAHDYALRHKLTSNQSLYDFVEYESKSMRGTG